MERRIRQPNPEREWVNNWATLILDQTSLDCPWRPASYTSTEFLRGPGLLWCHARDRAGRAGDRFWLSWLSMWFKWALKNSWLLQAHKASLKGFQSEWPPAVVLKVIRHSTLADEIQHRFLIRTIVYLKFTVIKVCVYSQLFPKFDNHGPKTLSRTVSSPWLHCTLSL